jgi:predicted alpha/beta hydrolase family esterase
MRNAIILHGLAGRTEYYDPGRPSISNSNWLPWLQKQLLINEIKADVPEIPRTFEMKYEPWVTEVERFDMKPDTILVGHSMGGGFWLRYLSEHPGLRVAKVILVAPWLNRSHEADTQFFDFTLSSSVTTQSKSFVVFASDNDNKDIRDSVAFLREKLPGVTFRDFHNYGHFCYDDMKTDAFPELLEEVLR